MCCCAHVPPTSVHVVVVVRMLRFARAPAARVGPGRMADVLAWQMAEKPVWVVLRRPDGPDVGPTRVDVRAPYDIDRLKKAVKIEFGDDLPGISAARLEVFLKTDGVTVGAAGGGGAAPDAAAAAAGTVETPLRASAKVPEGTTEDNPLIVRAPARPPAEGGGAAGECFAPAIACLTFLTIALCNACHRQRVVK